MMDTPAGQHQMTHTAHAQFRQTNVQPQNTSLESSTEK